MAARSALSKATPPTSASCAPSGKRQSACPRRQGKTMIAAVSAMGSAAAQARTVQPGARSVVQRDRRGEPVDEALLEGAEQQHAEADNDRGVGEVDHHADQPVEAPGVCDRSRPPARKERTSDAQPLADEDERRERDEGQR